MHAPFYLDDFSSITENPWIMSADWPEIWAMYKYRIVGYTSFALNAQYLDGSPFSFRIVNILIHCVNASLVYFLVNALLKAESKNNHRNTFWIATAAALIFALHPLHTGAVTYIVQRLASLATMFFLFSVLMYLLGRLHRNPLLIVLSLISCVLAILTKQNTITLIPVLVLCELLVIRNISVKWLILTVVGTILAGLFALLTLYLVGFDIAWLDAASRETKEITRFGYFYIQLAVIGHYLSLFVWPDSLMLNYGLTLEHWKQQYNFLWGAFHLSALVIAVAVSRRYPVAAFSIFFFYVTHSVESAFIPIRDVIFEHRAYLPNVGLLLLLATLYHQRFSSAPLFTKRSLAGLLVVVVGTLSYLTHQRNTQWADPKALYRAEIEKNGGFWRSRSSLASINITEGNIEEAYRLLDIENYPASVHPAMIVNALNVLLRLEKIQQAKELQAKTTGPILSSHYRYKIKFYSLSGQLFTKTNELDRALEYFDKALALKPDYIEVLGNKGIALALIGQYEHARTTFRKALMIKPNSDKLKRNLQAVDTLEEQRRN